MKLLTAEGVIWKHLYLSYAHFNNPVPLQQVSPVVIPKSGKDEILMLLPWIQQSQGLSDMKCRVCPYCYQFSLCHHYQINYLRILREHSGTGWVNSFVLDSGKSQICLYFENVCNTWCFLEMEGAFSYFFFFLRCRDFDSHTDVIFIYVFIMHSRKGMYCA